MENIFGIICVIVFSGMMIMFFNWDEMVHAHQREYCMKFHASIGSDYGTTSVDCHLQSTPDNLSAFEAYGIKYGG